jgi:transposase-like protein
MDIHKNARLTLRSREELVNVVLSGKQLASVARQFRVTSKTAGKWVARYRLDGIDGLQDRSSRPLRSPTRLSEAVNQLHPAPAVQDTNIPLPAICCISGRTRTNATSTCLPGMPITTSPDRMVASITSRQSVALIRVQPLEHLQAPDNPDDDPVRSSRSNTYIGRRATAVRY